MAEENIAQELRLKNKGETKCYFNEQIIQNHLINKKYKKIFTTLNYIQHLLILASTFTEFVSIFDFASLVGLPMIVIQ